MNVIFMKGASLLLPKRPSNMLAFLTASHALLYKPSRRPPAVPLTTAPRSVPKMQTTKATPKRTLSTHPKIKPDGTIHHLKANITPSPQPSHPQATTHPPPPFEPPLDKHGKVMLKDMTLPEMERWVEEILGQKRFRARQLWQWLYKPERLAISFDEMSDLSKSFRLLLKEHARITVLGLNSIHQSKDGTRKLTFRLDAGGVIETVLIPAEGRTTLCVSSQWGCALNCQFCLTGRTGFKRSLTTGEIVEQLVHSMRLFGDQSQITNVVFMGEGEPAHNLDNVLRAVDAMTHEQGLQMSPRKVTVSTSGLIPEIRRFAEESKANLAVSLHATNDELRSWLMPINRKYGLQPLMQTLREVFPRRRGQQRKVMFQYVMLKDVNDSLEDAKQLLRLTAGVPCKINLIQFNWHEGSEFEGSSEETMESFQRYLSGKGMTVTIRRSRGDDEMMACGQLGTLGALQPPRMKVPPRYAQAVSRTGSTA
ncbi:Dual-specificity RNA methyltransferase RlmN [Gracilariopsis chorda]|uniref:Dual-specificity RNA methyltransferase RlmN n=1 Tax=Gracilariopsis chorda TaxID=448386 RepID=A0A2V3IHE4_9FLOR|nr:Dual-specificity RNA methyltransferase RlmN [Gracilariopsis chorda]|eukprot:PXF41479.1 Dual-specificity RNA methyltransferase RlmN [Gracilariopsis chorda]